MSNSAAMEKALKSIEMSFNPVRSAITDKKCAMMRTVTMLADPHWASRAWSNVAEYDITNTDELVAAMIELRDAEEEFVGHEFIVGADWNVRDLNRGVEKVANL